MRMYSVRKTKGCGEALTWQNAYSGIQALMSRELGRLAKDPSGATQGWRGWGGVAAYVGSGGGDGGMVLPPQRC